MDLEVFEHSSAACKTCTEVSPIDEFSIFFIHRSDQ
jgi:hypothetical protein